MGENRRVAILAAADNAHTVRWVNGLLNEGIEVHLISQHTKSIEISDKVTFHQLKVTGSKGYFLNAVFLKNILKKINPHLLNIHYASGYGVLGSLTGFKPILLSVWGSDIFEFPQRSVFHAQVIKRVLESSTQIASTSYCMRDEIRKYNKNKKINITPFGIDLNVFTPRIKSDDNAIIIGTVKTLEYNYGIDLLIDCFHDLKNIINPNIKIKLKIVGGGSQLQSLLDKVNILGLEDDVEFTGRINHSEVPLALSKFDIFVALSRAESFGVSVLEASAVGLPVVVSNALGFKEVIVNNSTGFIVDEKNRTAILEKIAMLISDKCLRSKMGENGISFVAKNFTWESSLKLMLTAYSDTINNTYRTR